MTPSEYIQLKAFARQDGVLMAVLWTVSFAFYVMGLTRPTLGMLAILLALMTPFFMWQRLKKYRDGCLDGVLSLRRGWAFVIFTFFYGSLLFAAIQFVYFSYMDNGRFFKGLTQMFSDPANAESLKSLGIGSSLGETLHEMAAMRPIDLVLNILSSNLLMGLVAGLPIAAMAKRVKS